MSCDSLVALPNATGAGMVLFAKNSDRPAMEAQPLCDVATSNHAPGASLRCTYIEIPQVEQTFRVIGSRPYWCWGFEHGVNEHGVAIGNHSVFAKAGLAGHGLIGMDLVRLGLERSRTADEAAGVITSLLQAYGQGGSGYADKDWAYHNSFLVADRTGALLLETCDRHWVVRRVQDVASLSNHLSIGNDWDAISDGAIEFAIAQGWWREDGEERFDFAAAFRDIETVPEAVSVGRHRRTCALLESAKGRLSPSDMRNALRDHYGFSAPRGGRTPVDPEYFSVCMHADPVGTTTASVVAEIPASAEQPLLYWAVLGAPCVGVFLPLYLDGVVPAVLTHANETPSNDSPWWRFKHLLTLVEQNWESHFPRVRDVFDPFEAATTEAITRLAQADRAERQEFVHYTVNAALDRTEDLIRRLS